MNVLNGSWWYLYLVCFYYTEGKDSPAKFSTREYDHVAIIRLYCPALLYACLLVLGPLKINGIAVQQLIDDAIFVNGLPIPDPQQHLNLSRQLLLPFMNFTCNGTLRSLEFVATSDCNNAVNLMSWPYFSLWHHRGGYFEERSHIGPSINPLSVGSSLMMNRPFIATLTQEISFRDGDILGVQLHQQGRSHPGPIPHTRSVFKDGTIKVLKQIGGYGLTQVCDCQNDGRCCEPNETSEKIQEIPYIAIETSKA